MTSTAREVAILEKSTVIGIVAGLVSVFVGMIIKGAPLSSLQWRILPRF